MYVVKRAEDVSMSSLTLEPDVVAKLRIATEPCWLRDVQGNVVGYFHPGRPQSPKVYPEGVVPELSEEEIQRRLSEPGGRTWDEIKHDLERLT
jgi:hypothetical protein